MGRPKGSKNRVKNGVSAVPQPQNKETVSRDFDKLNAKSPPTPAAAKPSPAKTSSSSRKRKRESSPIKAASSSPEKRSLLSNGGGDVGGGGGDKENENGDVVVSIDMSEGGKDQPATATTKTLKIIQLGSEESKKYAVLPQSFGDGDDEEDADDFDADDYADREDHEISFEGDEDENDDDKEYGDDDLTMAPEETSTIKHAKKYPSKQKYPCPKCPKVWNWAWELRRHLVVHFKPSKYGDGGHKCGQCDKTFQWKRDLKAHERFHTGEKVLFCSVCEKQFITKQALLHHVVVHTGEKPFQCAVCGNKFTQPANLRTHVKKKHNYNPEANKNNKCEYCGEPHQSVVSLHQHLLEDHPQQVQEEREILAREKQMRLKERLQKEKEKEERRRKREQLGHKVRKPKKKEWEMDFEFYIGDGLVRGVDWDRTPSNGEIACGQCERKFGWRFEIMFHGLCHLLDEQGNARNKICPECDTPFKVPIGLKHHLITHTGETPFLCLHCWKSFSSHIDLKLHVKKEHMLHMNKKKGDKRDEEEEVVGEELLAEVEGEEHNIDEVLEEQTSHFVQLDDGTYAQMQMVNESNTIAPTAGQPILVKNDKGETMVVVSPANHVQDEIITDKVVADNTAAGTVYVIAAAHEVGGGEAATAAILPDKESLERLIGEQDHIEMIVEEDTKVIQVNEM